MYDSCVLPDISLLRVSAKLMVFNATFNKISAISWLSVLLIKETGVPKKTTDLL